MNEIPLDKLKFYSERQLKLRYWGNQLRRAMGDPKVNFGAVARLENEIVDEAFRNIAKQGKKVLITSDQRVYAQDLERKIEDGKVYILCNDEGDLQDLTPLLPYISARKRMEYNSLKSRYLRSSD